MIVSFLEMLEEEKATRMGMNIAGMGGAERRRQARPRRGKQDSGKEGEAGKARHKSGFPLFFFAPHRYPS